MVKRDWIDFILMAFVFLLLFAGLLITNRRGHKKDEKEQDYKLGVLSKQISKDIKEAVKEGVKEALKEAIGEQQSGTAAPKK